MTNNLKQSELEKAVQRAIANKVFPCMEILLARGDEVIYHQTFGKENNQEEARDLKKNAIFDLSSLTKPLATTFAILHLLDRGKLSLSTKLSEIFNGICEDKASITIHHLLTHTSGLPAWSDLFSPDFDRQQGWRKLLELPLENPPGSKMVYSCLDFIFLGEIIRRISQQSLAKYCFENIFSPLGLKNTGFNPSTIDKRMIATDTCPYRKKRLQGIVHDENAYLFEGEGGNAGLFSTAEEVRRLCSLIFRKGRIKGRQIISRESIDLLLINHNPQELTPHSLGWDYNPEIADYKSCGDRMPAGSIGHLGFTGTSLWLDPKSGICIIILSNRVYYGREHKIEEMRKLRPEIHTFLYSMIDSPPLSA